MLLKTFVYFVVAAIVLTHYTPSKRIKQFKKLIFVKTVNTASYVTNHKYISTFRTPVVNFGRGPLI